MAREIRVSDLSDALKKEFQRLGKKLEIEVTPETSLSLFGSENIRDKKLQQQAEKALRKAEQEVQALVALHLRHPVPTPSTSHTPHTAPFKPSAPRHRPLAEEPLVRTFQSLSREESIRRLQDGNRTFQRELEQRGKKPVRVEKYDILLLMCSDARCDATELETYLGQNVLVVEIAGNVSGKYLKTALEKLKDGAEVIVCGHTNCGACDAKKSDPRGKATESKPLRRLLDRIDIASVQGAEDIYAANVLHQANALAESKLVQRKKLKVTPALFQPEKTEQPLKSLLGRTSEFLSTLQQTAGQRLAEAKREGKDLSIQYAHAVVVGDSTSLGLFTDPRLVFAAGLNELFCVNAPAGHLNPEAIASIEFALLHVAGVKETAHIVLLHSNPKQARSVLETLLSISDIIRSKTQGGKTVTLMRMDPNSGAVSVVSPS